MRNHTWMYRGISFAVAGVLALVGYDASAVAISVINPSFEELAPGVALDELEEFTCGVGCNPGSTAPKAVETSDPIVGWTLDTPVRQGTFYPSAFQYHQTAQGLHSEPADGVPDGLFVAYSIEGTISQILSETLVADLLYTLSVDVGDRFDQSLPSFEIQLLAGGNVLASTASTTGTLPNGGFDTAQLTFSALNTHPDIGELLEIRLINTSGPTVFTQVNFDNVRLTAVPEPSVGSLLGVSLAGLAIWRRRSVPPGRR